MKLVVSNSGPLIGLSMIGQFDLLKVLFGAVNIPSAVYREVAIEGQGKLGAEEVAKAVKDGWITVNDVEDSLILGLLKVDLDDGEAEALALADRLNADLLLMDERKGRVRAKQMRREVIGTIGVLLLAREKGVDIDPKVALDELRKKGFRISDKLYRRILRSQKGC